LIAIYFFYFKGANAQFAAAGFNPAELVSELARWERWHWVRVVMALVAFVASLLGLRAIQSSPHE
jgi:hypothetical protein